MAAGPDVSTIRASSRSIAAALDQYCRAWGPIDWRAQVATDLDVQPDDELAMALLSLAAIETDSRIIARKVRAGRVDDDQYLHEFLIIWQAEESEHGRALDHLARQYGATGTQSARFRLRARELIAIKVTSRLLPMSVRSAYCTLGAVQEYVAMKTYQAVARTAGHSGVGRVLRTIAAQESRHMKFYLTAAQLLLDGHPIRQRLVRAMLQARWAPPGVDLLGEQKFVQAFGFLLKEQSYVDDVVGVDSFAGRIPGMGGMNLMRSWLLKHGAEPQDRG